jgi:hypothetical protein
MSQGAADRELSRRQGLFTTANTASLAIASGTSGFLFAINPVLPFSVMASISAAFALTTLFWWRHVQGRVSEPRTQQSGGVLSRPIAE